MGKAIITISFLALISTGCVKPYCWECDYTPAYPQKVIYCDLSDREIKEIESTPLTNEQGLPTNDYPKCKKTVKRK